MQNVNVALPFESVRPGACITALMDTPLAKRQEAVDKLLSVASTNGAPIVEVDPQQGDRAIVTYLFRGGAGVENVIIMGAATSWDLELGKLRNIPGSTLWYKSISYPLSFAGSYRIAVNDSLVPFDDEADWAARTRNWKKDPLNAQLMPFIGTDDLSACDLSVIRLQEAPKEEFLLPSRPDSDLTLRRLKSTILHNERKVWLYRPPCAVRLEAAALVIVFDGSSYVSEVPVPQLLDNLILAGKIPPLYAMLLCSIDQKSRNHELPCNVDFVEFLVQEALPFAQREFGATFEANRTAVCGSSYGGLAALFAALKRPDRFGLVLSQSGAFGAASHTINDTLLEREISALPSFSPRVWLDAGVFETTAYQGRVSILEANRRMKQVLETHGALRGYHEFVGHHDYVCWRETFARGMLKLFS
ncbi:MAG: DUF3327 domain-containing protein [Oligoflexia bacterium]|nr:DUF3327 domain-containing protein [Oligoflexia bacterium]